MKPLMLALLIPVAFCAACSKKEESVATPTPAPADVAPTAPATSPATAPAPAPAPATSPATARVSLVSAAGSSVKGDLSVINEGNAVYIRGEITGLAPGTEHGFHVHEIGKCDLPDFMSAGEHFNPTMDPHGKHLGDLPNAKADENGRANINAIVNGPNLVDKDGAPTAILGKALIVHAMPDDYKTQPSGGSGNRIACGVIRRSN